MPLKREDFKQLALSIIHDEVENINQEIQLLFNKNKLATSGNKILVDVCESIENKVCCIKGKSNNG